ncbi:hypothetical protein AGMMS50239_16890 [Bacteroidia bacterium]|nr:hypothetical protein AGMMS50239_16890 [Bacteroidia bacterium]
MSGKVVIQNQNRGNLRFRSSKKRLRSSISKIKRLLNYANALQEVVNGNGRYYTEKEITENHRRVIPAYSRVGKRSVSMKTDKLNLLSDYKKAIN